MTSQIIGLFKRREKRNNLSGLALKIVTKTKYVSRKSVMRCQLYSTLTKTIKLFAYNNVPLRQSNEIYSLEKQQRVPLSQGLLMIFNKRAFFLRKQILSQAYGVPNITTLRLVTYGTPKNVSVCKMSKE